MAGDPDELTDQKRLLFEGFGESNSGPERFKYFLSFFLPRAVHRPQSQQLFQLPDLTQVGQQHGGPFRQIDRVSRRLHIRGSHSYFQRLLILIKMLPDRFLHFRRQRFVRVRLFPRAHNRHDIRLFIGRFHDFLGGFHVEIRGVLAGFWTRVHAAQIVHRRCISFCRQLLNFSIHPMVQIIAKNTIESSEQENHHSQTVPQHRPSGRIIGFICTRIRHVRTSRTIRNTIKPASFSIYSQCPGLSKTVFRGTWLFGPAAEPISTTVLIRGF